MDFRRQLKTGFPSGREIVTLVAALAVWMGVTAVFVGIRPEHWLMTLLLIVLFFSGSFTRKLAIALLPFVVFAISYDWMRIVPNYEVNPIDVKGLYEAEKHLFGIATAQGVLTPNEFFAVHHCAVMDFMAGVFYLCWVPVLFQQFVVFQ